MSEPDFDTRFYSEAMVIKLSNNPFFKNSEYVYELGYNFLDSFKGAFCYKENKLSKYIDITKKKIGCATNTNKSYVHFSKTLLENFRITRNEKAKSELFLKLLDSELITNITLKIRQ